VGIQKLKKAFENISSRDRRPRTTDAPTSMRHLCVIKVSNEYESKIIAQRYLGNTARLHQTCPITIFRPIYLIRAVRKPASTASTSNHYIHNLHFYNSTTEYVHNTSCIIITIYVIALRAVGSLILL